MFYLQKNASLSASYRATEGIRSWAEECLADASAGLVFDPEEHRYFLGRRELRSVSSIVEHFAPFDAEKMAARVALNPKHPLFGKTVEEILAIWKESGRQAASAGTDVHAFGEACFLYMTGQEDQIEEQFRERIHPEGLLATEPKEIALARWWQETDWKRFAPVAKETRVVNPQLGYAGTFDLLLYDQYNASFCVDDYKTNKDLERWFGDMLLPPLSMLRSNDLGKYTVQQTLYTIVLRMIGFLVSNNCLIWLREDGYRNMPLPLQYDKVVAWAVTQFNNENSKPIQSCES